MLSQQKLLTVDAFRVQVRFGEYIFLAFLAGFSPGGQMGEFAGMMVQAIQVIHKIGKH